MLRRTLAVAVLSCLGVALGAQDRRLPRPAGTTTPGRRVALCIGNDAYPAGALKNPANDARAVAAALREAGFEAEVRTDVDRQALERAVGAFVSRLAGAGVGFFFYAGHGIQIEGENYLLPVDFAAGDEVEAKYHAFGADELRERLEAAGARVNVIVLDACRDNPFRRGRSGTRGLVGMDTGRGTLVALATGPGQVASDSPRAPNGLFTQALLAALREPGLRIQDVFERTKAAVWEASGAKQRPWIHSDLIGDVYLRPAAGVAGAAAPVPADAPPAASAVSRAEVAPHPDADEDPTLGPPDAAVTIVEFADYQCPFSARAETTLRQLRGRYGNRLRIVFRDFPLQQVHREAAAAAEAAGCGGEQGRFWEMHDALFAAPADLGPEGLRRRAGEAGLSLAAFDACLASGRFRAGWRKDVADGERHGVQGTPAFLVNGRLLTGARSLEDFVAVIEDALAGR